VDHTHLPLFAKQCKLVPTKGRRHSECGNATAGLAENNDSLLLGLWLTSPAGRLTLKPEISTGPYGLLGAMGDEGESTREVRGRSPTPPRRLLAIKSRRQTKLTGNCRPTDRHSGGHSLEILPRTPETIDPRIHLTVLRLPATRDGLGIRIIFNIFRACIVSVYSMHVRCWLRGP